MTNNTSTIIIISFTKSTAVLYIKTGKYRSRTLSILKRHHTPILISINYSCLPIFTNNSNILSVIVNVLNIGTRSYMDSVSIISSINTLLNTCKWLPLGTII